MAESLKPLENEEPDRDKQKRWTPPGTVTQTSYNRKKFKALFKKEK